MIFLVIICISEHVSRREILQESQKHGDSSVDFLQHPTFHAVCAIEISTVNVQKSPENEPSKWTPKAP